MQRFDAYMSQWLYGTGGYYTTYKEIGKKGDFYTSVSVSPLFGGAIASHLIHLIDQGLLTPSTVVCEIGAHKGYLIADVIQFIYTLRPELLSTLSFHIVERFDALQQVQKEYLYHSFGDAVHVTWSSGLEQIHKAQGFIFANEIFDAFPARIFRDGQEGYVKDHHLVWQSDSDLVITHGEIAVGYEKFALDLYQAFDQAVFITADYGQKWERNEPTLRLYDEHTTIPLREFDDLSSRFQRCDITYDVNFSHIFDAFSHAQWENLWLKEQMSALVDFGLIDLLEKLHASLPYEHYVKEVAKAKILISPDEMGSRFKFFGASKGV